jgi:hypothetical protein
MSELFPDLGRVRLVTYQQDDIFPDEKDRYPCMLYVENR